MIKNNWISTSLDKRTRTNLNDFSIKIKSQDFDVDTFENNSARVAKEIFESYENVHLLYSGGLDSEYVFKVFIEQNLPIKTILVSTPFNKAETAYAVDFYKKHNLKPYVVSYTKNETIDLLSKKCLELGYSHLIGAIPLVLSDQLKSLNYNLVTGMGEPFYISSSANSIRDIETKLSPYYFYLESDFYLNHAAKHHPGSFYTYDIALHHSMISKMQYTGNLQRDKSNLYGLEYREKIFWDIEFFNLTKETIPKPKFDYVFVKTDLYKKAIERNLIKK